MNECCVIGGIAIQTLLLASFLSLTWGIYLAGSVRDLSRTRGRTHPRPTRQDVILAYRRTVVALCLFMLPFSLLIRAAFVVAGLGQETAGQVVFFALVGTNVPGSIFAALTYFKPTLIDDRVYREGMQEE